MTRVHKLETKKICNEGHTHQIAKRVIQGEPGLTIRHDNIEYSYDKETNTLTLKDAFGSTKYEPKFIGGMIVPFDKRKDSEVY